MKSYLFWAVVCSIMFVVASGNISNKSVEVELEDPYTVGVEIRKVFGFNSIKSIDRISEDYIEIIELKDDLSDSEILTELIQYISSVDYNPIQPYPYYSIMETSGANCQAYSIWLSTQLTYYGIQNSLYLSEGKDHMYNEVLINGQAYKVDLSRKVVENE